LIEVLLAIAISTGLLLAAVLFYHQTTELRTRILEESERTATIRQVMDRITADLRTAQPRPGVADAFSGGEDALRFSRVALNLPLTDGSAPLGWFGSDLTQITLNAVHVADGTNQTVAGLDRRESPVGWVTNTPVVGGLNPAAGSQTPTSTSTKAILADSIRFVRFRYWDGAAWVDGWTNSMPPAGIEITLANDPAGDGKSSDEYPADRFRRVVFIPGGMSQPQADLDSSGSTLSP
jgi:type II secretory pathway pseudopilin PulG